MNYYTVATRDTLADLIEAIPMDEDAIITHQGARLQTVYKFPAMMKPDGSEIEPRLGHWVYDSSTRQDEWVYSHPSPEDHREHQIKRRARIARKVRRSAKRDFE